MSIYGVPKTTALSVFSLALGGLCGVFKGYVAGIDGSLDGSMDGWKVDFRGSVWVTVKLVAVGSSNAISSLQGNLYSLTTIAMRSLILRSFRNMSPLSLPCIFSFSESRFEGFILSYCSHSLACPLIFLLVRSRSAPLSSGLSRSRLYAQ